MPVKSFSRRLFNQTESMDKNLYVKKTDFFPHFPGHLFPDPLHEEETLQDESAWSEVSLTKRSVTTVKRE